MRNITVEEARYISEKEGIVGPHTHVSASEGGYEVLGSSLLGNGCVLEFLRQRTFQHGERHHIHVLFERAEIG